MRIPLEICLAAEAKDFDIDRVVKNFPIFPNVAMKIISITEEGLDLSFGELEDIIKIDPMLSAKIIKVANSALYARQKEIVSLKMAISLIGFKTIKSLVLLVSVSNMFDRFKKYRFYKRFWRHSLDTAFIGKFFVRKTLSRDRAEEVFLAGLFHDIGQIALFSLSPEDYENLFDRREREKLKMRNLEAEFFGLTHVDAGARILNSWNFPSLFVDAAREHGNENITSSNKPLIAVVTAADTLSYDLEGLPIDEVRTALLSRMAAAAGFPLDTLPAFREELAGTLEKDPLYRECKNIF